MQGCDALHSMPQFKNLDFFGLHSIPLDRRMYWFCKESQWANAVGVGVTQELGVGWLPCDGGHHVPVSGSTAWNKPNNIS